VLLFYPPLYVYAMVEDFFQQEKNLKFIIFTEQINMTKTVQSNTDCY
jgi:hypothetical protein